MFATSALVAVVLLQQQPPPPIPPKPTLEARESDLLLVNGPVRIPIIRRHEGGVRVVHNATEKWLILMVDRSVDGAPPDGQVDRSFTFQEVDQWPLGATWSGKAAIEEYTLFGDRVSDVGIGLRTGSGLILALPAFRPRSQEAELFRSWGSPEARKAVVNRVVTLDVVIADDGGVIGARAIGRDFLLFEAAITAVRQWRYEVREINGLRVPVSMTVALKFQ